jgi:hypothetical protein
MIAYADGSRVCVGDRVLMNQGREPGIVHALIDSNGMMDSWGLEETGVMIEVAPGELHFWPADSLSFEEEIRFISRNAAEPGVAPKEKSASSPPDP